MCFAQSPVPPISIAGANVLRSIAGANKNRRCKINIAGANKNRRRQNNMFHAVRHILYGGLFLLKYFNYFDILL